MPKSNKVLVTGATGFLGSHLCRKLANLGCDVVGISTNEQRRPYYTVDVPSQRKIVYLNIDVTKAIKVDALFKEYRFDLVFHLVGIPNRKFCKENFEISFDVNVVGTKNMLLFSGNCDRVIFMSSAAVYGDSQASSVDESQPTLGSDPYAITKIVGEKLCLNFIKNYGRTIAIVRNFYSFGIGQLGTYVVPTLIHQALREKKIKLWNRNYVMDLMYVDNTIDALVEIGNRGTSEIYNIGSGRGTKISELARSLRDIIDRTIQISHVKQPNWRDEDDVRGIVANNTKLRSLGWRERVGFKEGLFKTVQWHRSIHFDNR